MSFDKIQDGGLAEECAVWVLSTVVYTLYLLHIIVRYELPSVY